MERARRVGMPWYRREDYPGLRAVMADRAGLPENYELWRLSAEQVESEVIRSGVEVVRVPVEADRFLAWCNGQGLAPNGAARARYASEMAASQTAGGSDL